MSVVLLRPCGSGEAKEEGEVARVIKDPKLTKNQLDMLYRVALAEFWTSPSTPLKYDGHVALSQLRDAKLVDVRGGLQRLSAAGRATLNYALDPKRRAVLDNFRARRASRKESV